jgi:hypothetical protein
MIMQKCNENHDGRANSISASGLACIRRGGRPPGAARIDAAPFFLRPHGG